MTIPTSAPEIEPVKMTEAQEASKRLRELSVEMLKVDADMKLPWGMIDPDDGADVIDNLSTAVASLHAQNEALVFALEIIAGKRQCLDNLMSHADVARAALSAQEGV